MLYRASFAALVLAAVSSAAWAFDDGKYLDLSGQWVAVRERVGGQPAFDPNRA
jgi:hypothetical protein